MIRINLLPVREIKKQARLRVQTVMLGIAATAGAVVCLGIHVSVAAQAAKKRSEIVGLQAELAKLEATRKEVDRYRAEEAEISQKLRVIDSLESSRLSNVRLMDQIASSIPERMWLSQLTLAEGDLHIQGVSIDAEIVAQFLSRLEGSPGFSGVELEETSLNDLKGVKVNVFKIRGRYGEPVPTAGEPGVAPAAPGAPAGE